MDKAIDISWSITGDVSSWRNNYPIKVEHNRTYEEHKARATSIEHFYMHTGTHIDAPSHFLKDGKNIESIPLSAYNGPCKVIACNHLVERITSKDLEGWSDLIFPNDILLFQTKNSALSETDPFNDDFVFLDVTGADWCVKKKIKAVGIDYLGIENSKHQKNHETHSTLMENGIVIIEGLSRDRLNLIF
jgi:arylformamidase